MACYIVAAQQGKILQLMSENRLQQIRSKKMVDQISSEMIGAIDTSIPLEDNATISRDARSTFVLQQLEE